jgi:nucleotide-binding universal stress UspA family protein
VLHGPSPTDAIVQACAKLGSDAVVVGSRARHGTPRGVLSSVIEGLLKDSARPVIVVGLRGARK